MDRSRYLDRWSDLHGYDARANPLVRWWLGGTYVVAKRLADAGVSPHALTAAGVVAAGGAAVCAGAGEFWWPAAAGLIAVSAFLDSLDGAVAMLRGVISRLGVVLDAIADRLSDAALLLALWLAGADAVGCLVGALLMLGHESVRSLWRMRGDREVHVVTVSERPTRVIVTFMFLLAGGVLGDARWPFWGAWAWVGLGAIGLTQLLLTRRRRRRL